MANEILYRLLETAWFLLPAMAANLLLYLAGKLLGEGLGPPIDFGKHWRGQRLIGDGRTLIGLPLVLVVGGAVGLLQGDLWTGLILALGVDIGTVIHSFIKRRLGKPRGSPHHPWDHIDYVIGALAAYAFWGSLSLTLVGGSLVLGGFAHWLASKILRPLLDQR